jgi:hypothetical protein
MATATQLSLIRPDWFHPVPAGRSHYVVVLQSQLGERTALANTSPTIWTHITPLIEILGPKQPDSQPYSIARIRGWVKKVSEAVGTRPCFLDTLRLPPSHSVRFGEQLQPALSVIYGEARKRGMEFVPVLRLGDARKTVGQIAQCAGSDGRGIALRYRLLGAASADGRTTATVIRKALDAVEAEPSGTDLILDMEFLPEDVEVDPEDLAHAVDDLAAAGDWRSVVLIGCSMPSSLGGGVVPEGTIGRLPRHEWLLWLALQRLQPSRLPTFGDYAVQNPRPPLEDQPSGPGQRANIRYTTDEATLVPRAVGPVIQHGPEQYRELCQLLVAQPEFAGPEFSWGDRVIADCANGTHDPGWQTQWRAAGTSHHLNHVVHQLVGVS